MCECVICGCGDNLYYWNGGLICKICHIWVVYYFINDPVKQNLLLREV